MTIKHIGRIHNLAHHASPVVIGDFELMKQWPGDIDGEAEGSMELGGAMVFGFTALELGAPSVFIEDGVVSLLTKEGETMPSEVLPDDLAALLHGELEDVEEEGKLSVSSGALVVTLAYNATPEEGAPTDALEYFSDGMNTLPKEVPTDVVYFDELAIIPIAAGEYSVVWGSIGDYERCQIRKA